MTAQSYSPALSTTTDRRWDATQFRVIFALSFVAFLVGAAAMRLSPKYWREAPHRSIFAQAWEASGTTAQFAFFG